MRSTSTALCFTLLSDKVFARGGGTEAGGEVFLGILGVALGFIFSKAIGKKMMPNSDETLQVFIGFLSTLLAVVLLFRIF